MITRYDTAGLVWLDIERPTAEEAQTLSEEFGLGPMVTQEIMGPTLKPRVDVYPNFLYTVLHFPATRDTRGSTSDHEVDIIIGKGHIITVHYESVNAIQDFSSTFEAVMLLRRSTTSFHSSYIIFEIAQRLYHGVENELEVIEDSVAAIEKSIFNGDEKLMVRPLSNLTRELLNHKRLIGNQEETLRELERAGNTLFGEEFKLDMSRVIALHYRVYNHALMLMDTLSELRNTNDSLLTTRQNEIMKNLTIMASVMLPLSLIASIFGMNTVNNPIIGTQYDFWTIVGVMSTIGIVAMLYFWHKRWF